MGKRTLSAVLLFGTVLLFGAYLASLGGCSSGQVVLTIAGGSQGNELDLTIDAVRRFESLNPGIKVLVAPSPTSATDRLKLYQSHFIGGDAIIDVLQIDIVWPSILAEYAVDLKQYIDRRLIDQHFARIIENNIVDGKLVGLPWFTDLPALYYRKDLLKKYGFAKPPTTWTEMADMAKTIQDGERSEGLADFWGYVWQGRPYEGLTCNALEWQHSFGGGNILDKEGRPSFANSKTAQALKQASSWIASISPPDIVNFDEEDARGLWQRGRAAFMRNWTNAFHQSKKDGFLADRVGVTTMPRGEAGSAATLGGWQLMISNQSSHPKQAAKLVEFLCRDREQRRRAVNGGYAPTIPALYKDPAVLEALPFLRDIETILADAVVRPAAIAGPRYDKVSETYWEAVSDVLNGADAEIRLKRASDALSLLLSSEAKAK